MSEPVRRLYTVGHGNRSLDEFLSIFHALHIQTLVDVRTYPVSRKHPHFSREHLERSLLENGFRYRWEGKDLGGFRKATPRSVHTAIDSDGFRAYADHMETQKFQHAVQRLLTLARKTSLAIMCAERLPRRCHRFFLSDFLMFRGIHVFHIITPDKLLDHRLNPLARAAGDRLVYDRKDFKQLNLGL